MAFLAGDGEMAGRMRAFDWTATSLGDPDCWSALLRSMVGMALAARQPVLIFWGAERRCLYNDAYRATLDDDCHPALLGQAAAPFWAEDWPNMSTAIAKVMAGGAATFDGRSRLAGPPGGKHTATCWSDSFCPIHDAAADGGIGGVVVFRSEASDVHPVVDRVGHPEETSAAMVLEATQAGLFDFDSRSDMVQLCDRALHLFGCAIRSPTVMELLERVHPDDRDALRSALGGSTRAKLFRLTLRLLPTPNDLRYIGVAGRFDADGSGRATGVFWDVTEHRLLVDTLRIADRRKDEFLAILAHELRNPLAALRSAAHLITRDGVTAERLRWCGEVIQRQSKALALLLDDLMEASQITRGKVELKLEPVELRAVVDAALETARPLIESCRHRLEIDLPAAPLCFEADPLRLGQVLTHLLINAARHTEPGGLVRLSAVVVEPAELRLEVVDNGVGIAPDQMPTLFEMFHRQVGAASTGNVGGGLGVGLSVSKGLLELHGGRLEAASHGPGRGSTFTVTLPLPTFETEGAADSGPTAPTILIADDNADAAEAIATLLGMEGYTVAVAHDGRSAFDAARLRQPFAAFLDIGMPGLNGYRLAAQIRRQPWGESMFLVAMTAWGQGTDRDRATAAGFDVHLVKPVDPDRVMALLARRLASRRRLG